MTKYYVSSSLGNDSNDGKSISTPWASVNKVNQSSNLFIAGDSILFKSSDIFYGGLLLPTNISSSGLLTVSAYGFGKKPKICGYKGANISGGWVQNSSNVWKLDLTNQNSYTGNNTTNDTNVGFIKVNGVIQGVKRFNLIDLASLWDFYSDSQYVYVYSTANPTTLASDIQIAVNNHLCTFVNNILVTGIEFVGTGGHGFHGTVSNAKVIGNDIHEIGGSQLVGYPTPNTRYGNGVEVWSGSRDVLIENNNIYDVYDVAYTMQGHLDTLSNGYYGWENIVYRNNTDWNCTQSFEVWSDYSGNAAISGTGFFNCIYELNTSLNAGYGWAYNVRPDHTVAVAWLVYSMFATNIDITVRRNTVYNPRLGLHYVSATDLPVGYKTLNNNLFLSTGQLINTKLSYTVDQFVDYQTAKGKEVGSSFFSIPKQNSNIPLTLASLMSFNALTTTQEKELSQMVGNINAKIEKIMAISDYTNIINTNNVVVEVKHRNNFMKPVGGYITKVTAALGTYYAPICQFVLKSSYARADLVLAYMLCGDQIMNRGGVGVVNIQIVPNLTLTTGTQAQMDIIETLEFTTGPSSQDFVLNIEVEDGTKVVATLYFNVGKDNYANLCVQPVNFYTIDTNNNNLIFYDQANLLTSLPAGTQINATKNNPYVKRPLTGSGSPASTPYYIGQEYADTTNKKYYKAMGTSGTSDWVLLN